MQNLLPASKTGVDHLANLTLDKHTPHDYETALLGKKIEGNPKAQVPTYYDT